MNDYIPPWVDAYIGLPFVEIDCYNLVRKVYAEQFTIDLPDLTEEYKNAFDIDSISGLYVREIGQNWILLEEPVFGCVPVFRVKGQLWHCGMVVNRDLMLHTQDESINSCLELFDSLEWKNKRVGFYSYVG
jgi:cell wall-associated NlpC family hydrolase